MSRKSIFSPRSQGSSPTFFLLAHPQGENLKGVLQGVPAWVNRVRARLRQTRQLMCVPSILQPDPCLRPASPLPLAHAVPSTLSLARRRNSDLR